MKFLIFGDVMGRPGREAVTQVLPELKKEYEPDSVIVNAENIAHGNGVSPDTMKDAAGWGVDVFTTGDHAWDNELGIPLLNDPKQRIIRPANYPPNVPGRGWRVWRAGAWQIAVINLQGQVFFRNDPLNPFHYLDQLLKEPEIAQANMILIDFHTEATSEMRALGWYADGRVSAIWGTHTHVPTADAQILPKGTGYLTDVGMTGAYHSIIGVEKEQSLKHFLTQTKQRMEPPEGDQKEVNALLLEIDPQSKKTTRIANIRKILNA